MLFYNPYTQFYTIVVLECDFLPSGMIDASKTMFYNVKAAYYRADGITLLRVFLEVSYVGILFLYTTLETKAIASVITKKFGHQKKLREADEERKKRKEAREAERKTRSERRSACNKDNRAAIDANENGEPDDEDEEPEVWDQGYGPEKDQRQKALEDGADALKGGLSTYLIGTVRSILLGLLDHFKNIWNFFDVVIIVLACISVPFWIRIVALHYSNLDLVSLDGKDAAAVSEELRKVFFEDADSIGKNFKQVAQGEAVQHIGHLLTMYRDMQGCLMLFVILKCLNFVEKFNKKVGMMF
jgi:hypothetical protein